MPGRKGGFLIAVLAGATLVMNWAARPPAAQPKNC